MTYTLNNTDDTIDLRDVIERYEELENIQDWHDTEHGQGDWVEAYPTDAKEFNNLKNLLEELKGCGGDEQWRGDWYPITLIRRSYFNEYMDEMVFDCYSIPELPSFMRIELDYVALEMDYSSVDIDGVEYLYR